MQSRRLFYDKLHFHDWGLYLPKAYMQQRCVFHYKLHFYCYRLILDEGLSEITLHIS